MIGLHELFKNFIKLKSERVLLAFHYALQRFGAKPAL